MDGIDISGMKLAEAEKVCRAAALKPYANINVTVKSGDTEMTAKGSELTESINAALEELIADGTVQAIIDKYIVAE